ncbi:MarR family winged helix-turn-helix transcriptional regulator [Bacillus sp. NP157]|nr:MarR family winged helix-turn-helix transcriptional regulator [Bacillus sp. NP157]
MNKAKPQPAARRPRKTRAVDVDFRDMPACTNTAMRLASRRLGNLYDDAFASVGLKATQVSLLAEVDRLTSAGQGKPPTLQELSLKLAILMSALTHALRPLVRDGLLELRQDADDGRTKRAALTRLGVTRLGEAGERWSVVNQSVEKVLGTESAATLRALADRVASDEFLLAFQKVASG